MDVGRDGAKGRERERGSFILARKGCESAHGLKHTQGGASSKQDTNSTLHQNTKLKAEGTPSLFEISSLRLP